MKKFLAALIFTCSAAFAAETVVLEVPARDMGTFTRLNSKMSVNMENGTVAGVLSAHLDREVCRWEYGAVSYRPYPGPWGGPIPGPVRRYVCFRSTDKVFSQTVMLQDLMIVNNEIMMKTDAGEVKCGVVKRGTIFKNTLKIVLNGNCTLTDRLVRTDGGKRAQLVLLTK